MDFHKLKDQDIDGKTVLIRVDLNVPRQNNNVTDTNRIDRLKPTIDYLRNHNAKILIVSHFGRPEGEHTPQMSLAFLTSVLEKQWHAPVTFSPQCIGDSVMDIVKSAAPKDIILLENVRFHKEEKQNDPTFAKQLAAPADLYVNDAFSVSHRAHASTCGVTKHLPACAGLLMEEELSALTIALETPERPVLAVAGGSKISTKLNVLENLIERVDYLVLGGGMANTFLNARGINMGKSLCEYDMADTARTIMEKAKKIGCEIILPDDVVVAKELKENAEHETVSHNDIPGDSMAIDIGNQSIEKINATISKCKTVLWNGPMGVFEIHPFDNGTNTVARHVAKQTRAGKCKSIAGGGDTVSALENAKAADDFSYISTAGGAFLEWLEGKELPGVKALSKTDQGTQKIA